jgi:hypothetical protein
VLLKLQGTDQAQPNTVQEVLEVGGDLHAGEIATECIEGSDMTTGAMQLSPEMQAAADLGIDVEHVIRGRGKGANGSSPEYQGSPLSRKNRFMSFSQLRNCPPAKPVVEGVFYANQEHVVFGPQGSAKTQIVLDAALHVVHHKEWMGRGVTPGAVVYVCGEGGGKPLANRIEAWLQFHEIEDHQIVDDLLKVTEQPVYLLENGDVSELLRLVGDEPVVLIIIDTLSANFGKGDENSPADMSAFCNAVRRIRLATGAGVVVIHHTGHHDTTRPQGSNKIRRDFDIELLVDRDANDERLFGLIGGGNLKSRNTSPTDMIAYRLENVTLPELDHFGNHYTSIVAVPTDEAPSFSPTASQTQRFGKNQVKVLKSLRCHAADAKDGDEVLISSADWVDVYKDAGLNKHQAKRVKDAFIEKGVFQFAVGGQKWIYQ